MSQDYKKIQQQGKEIMELYGWVRLWNMNSHRAVPVQARGLSDQGWINKDTGKIVFLEEKYGEDRPKKAQIEFRENIGRYAVPGVSYIVVEDFEGWSRVARGIR